MKLYTIKMPGNTYFAQNNSKNDNTFRFTEDVNKAQKYVSVEYLEKAISICKDKFKGAAIVDLDTNEVVKYIRCYENTLTNVSIIKETEKAIMINTGEWLPKSHVEICGACIGVSDWLYKTKFENKKLEVV